MDLERREVTQAMFKAHDALTMALAIQQLPANPGARVEWLHSGLVWTRIDDDKWQPEHADIDPDRNWPSSHIARFEWKVLTND